MMIRQVLSIAAILILLGVGTAQAQMGVVVMSGDHGKVAMLEGDTGGLVLRGGFIGRPNAAMDAHDWDLAGGLAWRFRGDSPLTMDLGLDVEPMAPGIMEVVDYIDTYPMMGQRGGLDMRARITVGWAVNERAAVVYERSRSLHNGTAYGRSMFGGRVGF